MTELLDAGLSALRAALDRGQVSPMELCDEYLSRYREWEPRLNAFVTISPDSIAAQARQAQLELSAGDHRGPLHGIPVAIKDNLDAAGEPTTAGSLAYRSRRPDLDAVVVARLRAAGAVIFGKTNLAELAYGPIDSYAFGPTYNPWKVGHYAGGSSMGSGAAVAAGVVPAALGTDTTGSIRNPASWCGVTGLKPTYGLVPVRGLVPLAPGLDHIGPIARSAVDCATILECIAGHDPRDIYSSTEVHSRSSYQRSTTERLPRMRLGVLRELWEPLIGDTGGILASALHDLEALGLSLVDIALPSWDDAVAATESIVEVQAALAHQGLLTEHAAELQPQVRERLTRGSRRHALTYASAETVALTFRRDMAQAFQRVDLIVLPGRERTAPTIDPSGARQPGEVGARYTTPFNLAGNPSLVAPCGFDANGLPVGIQVAAPHWHEAPLLQAVHAYQTTTDWHTRMPGTAQWRPERPGPEGAGHLSHGSHERPTNATK